MRARCLPNVGAGAVLADLDAWAAQHAAPELIAAARHARRIAAYLEDRPMSHDELRVREFADRLAAESRAAWVQAYQSEPVPAPLTMEAFAPRYVRLAEGLRRTAGPWTDAILARVEHSALARLLIARGVITEGEYLAAVLAELESEVGKVAGRPPV